VKWWKWSACPKEEFRSHKQRRTWRRRPNPTRRIWELTERSKRFVPARGVTCPMRSKIQTATAPRADTVKAICIHMIFRDIMWRNSIGRTKKLFTNPPIKATKKSSANDSTHGAKAIPPDHRLGRQTLVSTILYSSSTAVLGSRAHPGRERGGAS